MPANGSTRHRFGQLLMDTASVLTDAGRPAEALPDLWQGFAILEPLAAEWAAVHSYHPAVAECYDVLGAAQARFGRRTAALQSLAGARTMLEHLSAEHPDFVAYQADLAENHLWTGAVYHD